MGSIAHTVVITKPCSVAVEWLHPSCMGHEECKHAAASGTRPKDTAQGQLPQESMEALQWKVSAAPTGWIPALKSISAR